MQAQAAAIGLVHCSWPGAELSFLVRKCLGSKLPWVSSVCTLCPEWCWTLQTKWLRRVRQPLC